ncbi:MAG: hypothetical protein WD025_06855 [Bacteriovoracaceae bacterium]
MKEKNKNPLYVVKGKNVEEANGLADMLVKKLSLQPLIDFLKLIFKMLLEQVNSYPKLKALVDFAEKIVARLKLFQNYSFA